MNRGTSLALMFVGIGVLVFGSYLTFFLDETAARVLRCRRRNSASTIMVP